MLKYAPVVHFAPLWQCSPRAILPSILFRPACTAVYIVQIRTDRDKCSSIQRLSIPGDECIPAETRRGAEGIVVAALLRMTITDSPESPRDAPFTRHEQKPPPTIILFTDGKERAMSKASVE